MTVRQREARAQPARRRNWKKVIAIGCGVWFVSGIAVLFLLGLGLKHGVIKAPPPRPRPTASPSTGPTPPPAPKPKPSPTPERVEDEAPRMIGKIDAIETCKQAILNRLAHPSTVSFPTFDYDQHDKGSGRSELLMSFTAKNGFGLELSFDAECDFEGSDLVDVVTSEARGG